MKRYIISVAFGFLLFLGMFISTPAISGSWLLMTSAIAAAWGSITGTLSSQTDLQTALNGKVSTTGNETIAGAKTFSGQVTLGTTSSDVDLRSSTGARISILNASQNRISLCPATTGCGVNNSLSVYISETIHSNPIVKINPGPFVATYPSLGFRTVNDGTMNENYLVVEGLLSPMQGEANVLWSGAYYQGGLKAFPWYGTGTNRIIMGYEDGDALPSIPQGTVKVETGTNFSIEADKGLFNGYVFSAGEHNAASCTTTKTISWADQSAQKVDMEGNCTFTLTNPVAGGSYVLKLVQDGTGGRTYTWPSNVKWSGGTAPSASGANKLDLVNLYYDGTNYYGGYSLNYTP